MSKRANENDCLPVPVSKARKFCNIMTGKTFFFSGYCDTTKASLETLCIENGGKVLSVKECTQEQVIFFVVPVGHSGQPPTKFMTPKCVVNDNYIRGKIVLEFSMLLKCILLVGLDKLVEFFSNFNWFFKQ